MSETAMLLVAVAAAIVGAASFGLGWAVQQQITVHARPARPLDPRLLLRLIRRPLWVLGMLAILLGLCLQLVALAFGPLALVQPLLATGILFAAAFGGWLTRRRLDRNIVLGSLLCMGGLTGFLLLTRPRVGGSSIVGGVAPWLLAVALGAIVAACLLLAERSTGTARVLALAFASGLLFGLNAALMKIAASQALDDGGGKLFGNWQLYAACLIGPAGFLLAQNALQQSRALVPALAVIRSVDPVVGVAIGVLWFGEWLTISPSILVGELMAAGAVVGGIALLARWTMAVRQPVPAQSSTPGGLRLPLSGWRVQPHNDALAPEFRTEPHQRADRGEPPG